MTLCFTKINFKIAFSIPDRKVSNCVKNWG